MGGGRGWGGVRVSRWVWLSTGFPTSRAGRPRRPLGQPVMRGSVLVVGGRGRMVGTSWAVWVLGRTGRASVTLVAVVSPSGVPVMVGSAVIPLTARVIPLSLESTPVALENLRIKQFSERPWNIYVAEVSRRLYGVNENCFPQLTCLFGGGRCSLGVLWVWVGGGVSSRPGLATEEDVELQRDRFE